MSKREALAEDVVAEVAAARAPRRAPCSSACCGERVLAAHVEVAVLAAGREGGDRHRLDERERVALHQHAVLERAGLGLVGVADQVVRARRLAGDGVPLAAGRERGAAAAQQLRVRHLADHALGAELDRAPQRRVAAVRAVLVEARRIDGRRGTAEQAQRRVAGLRQHGDAAPGPGRRRRAAASTAAAVVGASVRSCGLVAGLARRARPARDRTGRGTGCGTRSRSRRRTARPRAPKRSSSCAISSSRAAQRQAMSSHTCTTRARARLDGEQRVERGDAVGVGRRHVEPAADVVERRPG